MNVKGKIVGIVNFGSLFVFIKPHFIGEGDCVRISQSLIFLLRPLYTEK